MIRTNISRMGFLSIAFINTPFCRVIFHNSLHPALRVHVNVRDTKSINLPAVYFDKYDR